MSCTVVTEDVFGFTSKGEEVKRYKLYNQKCNITVELITYGGAITVINVPDKQGKLVDVNLGFDNLKAYEDFPENNPYMGALVGRVAARIRQAKFSYKGKEYKVSANEGPHMLHGGTCGWSMVVWEGRIVNNSVVLSHTSKDGDQGFPGTVKVKVTYDLTDEGEVTLHYEANTDKTTPIDLTSHPYFNLAGEGTSDVHEHVITLNCDYYLPVDEVLIPLGEKAKVDGTPFDLRQPTVLGEAIEKVPGPEGGFMHPFCINGPTDRKKLAIVSHPGTGITMDVYTDQPSVVFYTAARTNVRHGKHGHQYLKYSGFCLETQGYTNAVNQKNFPDPFLNPESTYEQTTTYKFSVQK